MMRPRSGWKRCQRVFQPASYRFLLLASSMPGQQQSANGRPGGRQLQKRLVIFHCWLRLSKGNEAEPMQDEARFVKAALPNL